MRFGRPKKLTAHQRGEAIERISVGEAVAEVARTFGIDRATVYRLIPYQATAVPERGVVFYYLGWQALVYSAA